KRIAPLQFDSVVYSITTTLHLAILFPQSVVQHVDLHSFPTRRSSDLEGKFIASFLTVDGNAGERQHVKHVGVAHFVLHGKPHKVDRKSTRLNSSHVSSSYAVFCLKKINKTYDQTEIKNRKKQ